MAYQKNNIGGYCCAYDQQVNWYHPQKKTVVAKRMARWALAELYGFEELAWQPAKVEKVELLTDSIVISFDRDVKSSDDRPIAGFAIAGSDRHFFPAKAEYVVSGKDNRGQIKYDKSKLVISNPLVTNPVAVRYAWARVPYANLVNGHDRIIPVPQFRTDKWDYPEAPYENDKYNDHRTYLRDLSRQAEAWSKERRIKEAEFMLENR
jgi:sialate O-acetylesterase